jgi:choline dehydrogenase-like flavoprotein
MTEPGAQAVVVGSGAGGAVTALELARAGVEVLVIEEGERHSSGRLSPGSTEAMARLYRRRGMTPIVGPVPVGYVEGCCVGGSTEINSGFWHRAPEEILMLWKARYDLRDAGPKELQPHFEWAEQLCGVGLHQGELPACNLPFTRGLRSLEWSGKEIPRTAGSRQSPDAAADKDKARGRGMSQALLPMAETAGASIMTGCRVLQLLKRRQRVVGVIALQRQEDGTEQVSKIAAGHIFVCGGATETPSLLRRSGIKYHIGNSLRIHPMLKVVARFPEVIDAAGALPLIQVDQFRPDISLGGSYFSPGHLAMMLSDNWLENRDQMEHQRHMAAYYVAVRGTGKGYVHASALSDQDTNINYTLSGEDLVNLSKGLARLSMLLLAGGAEEIFPCVHGLTPIRSNLDAVRWLDDRLSPSRLSLTTVHAFSSCPMGENHSLCAADSFGKVRGFDNLYINDASMLPDSPGVNPQGSIMALARRNVLHFVDQLP